MTVVPGGFHHGSIPAYAGETASTRRCRRPGRVDPRVRGGDMHGRRGGWRDRGRSPRTRGRLPIASVNGYEIRSIPAYAGETSWDPTIARAAAVDPRVRGGDRSGAMSTGSPGGRSPRTRGRHPRAAGRTRAPGSIPAYAGETVIPRSPRTTWRVDPRVRGGDTRKASSDSGPRGRSPRTRGRLAARRGADR